MLHWINTICSSPKSTTRLCREEDQLIPITKASLLLVGVGSGAFGLVLGGARDASQALASAIKLPLVWIVTLAVCAPAFYAIAAVFGQPLRMRALLALTLSATARASLVLFALLPVLWLFSDVFSHSPWLYHQLTMLAALVYGLASLAALGVLLRGFDKSFRTLPLVGLFSVCFLLVAGQTAWSLRPFVGRPAQTDVPLLRSPEGTFFQALSLGVDSARGRYSVDVPSGRARSPREDP